MGPNANPEAGLTSFAPIALERPGSFSYQLRTWVSLVWNDRS